MHKMLGQIGNTPLHYLCENDNVTLEMLEAIMNSKRSNATLANSVRIAQTILHGAGSLIDVDLTARKACD